MAGIEVRFESFEYTRQRLYQTGIDDFLCKLNQFWNLMFNVVFIALMYQNLELEDDWIIHLESSWF